MRAPRAISNTQLTEFKKSPAHWKFYIEQERKDPTPAMVMGSLVHCLALQKEKLTDDFHLLDLSKRPGNDYRSKASREWKEGEIEKADGRTVIDTAQMDRAIIIVKALYENPISRDLLQRGEKFEQEIRWKWQGIECMGREDISAKDFICDLKVTDAGPRNFQYYIWKSGIYRQGGMYLDGEMKGQFVGDPFKRFYFIAVEPEPPFGVSVHELDAEVIQFGLNEYRQLMEQLKACLDKDYFPSYDFKEMDGIFSVTLPNYIYDNV